MSVKRRSTHSIFAAVFRRASGSHHDDLNPHGPRTPSTNLSHEDIPPMLTWSSSHDGWRRRASLVGDTALPANLASNDLLFAITSSGMTGDCVWLAVFSTPEAASPSLHESEQQTAPAGDNEGQVPAMPPTTRSNVNQSTDYTHNHMAIDASGRVWRLHQKDYIAFLDLVQAAQAETSVSADFHVAHTVTCQPMVYLVLPVEGAGVEADSRQSSTLRTVAVRAYSKHYRRLEASPLGENRERQVQSTPKELPPALYKLLGLAQEGIEGTRESDTNAAALLAVKTALPRSLLSSMYIPPDHAIP
ncbi:hypothetical protein EV715DRAFT_288499 [Schizophyllum commune]